MANFSELSSQTLGLLCTQVKYVYDRDSSEEMNRITKFNKGLIENSNWRHGVAILALLAPALYIVLANPENEIVTGAMAVVAAIGSLYFTYSAVDRFYLVGEVHSQQKKSEKYIFENQANALEITTLTKNDRG